MYNKKAISRPLLWLKQSLNAGVHNFKYLPEVFICSWVKKKPNKNPTTTW